MERTETDTLERFGQCEGGEIPAVIERPVTDTLERFGECEGSESNAAPERFITDFIDPVRDDDIGYVKSNTTISDHFATLDGQLGTESLCRPLLHLATGQLLVHRLIPGWFQSSVKKRWRV